MDAILDGRQPKGLRLAELLGNGPVVWEEQRSLFSPQLDLAVSATEAGRTSF